MFIFISTENETDDLKAVYNIDVTEYEESDTYVQVRHTLAADTVAESLIDMTENFEKPFVFDKESGNYILDIS